MTTPTAEDLRETVTGMDPDGLTLLLEVMRTARDLQTQAPGDSTEFLRECSEAMTAYVDAGGLYPGEVVKPILTEARARLALATATD